LLMASPVASHSCTPKSSLSNVLNLEVSDTTKAQ